MSTADNKRRRRLYSALAAAAACAVAAGGFLFAPGNATQNAHADRATAAGPRVQSFLAALAVPTVSAYVKVGGGGSVCTQLAPCGTFQAGYDAAPSGTAVQVMAGSYPAQTVAAGTKPVYFLGGGVGVTVLWLQVDADNVTFDQINLDGRGGSHDTLDTSGVHNFTFKNASIGNVSDVKGTLVGGVDKASDVLNDTFENVHWHDVLVTDPAIHNECVYNQASGLTIRNSTFDNCATMDVFITRGDWWGQEIYGGVTLENNSFGASRFENGVCCHYYGLLAQANMGTQMMSWTVRNNAFVQTVSVPGSASSDSVFCGNTGPGLPSGWSGACSGGTTTTVSATTPTTTQTVTTPTTTTTPTPPCALESVYRQSLTDLRASSIYANTYQKANRNEFARVDPWLTAPTSTLPAVSTAFGRFLVGHGRAYLIGCQ